MEYKNIGKYTFLIAFILIIAHHFSIIEIEDETIIDILYFYAIANLSLYVSFFYLQKYRKKAVAKSCPYCDSPLEELSKYKCPKCGILTPEREN